MGTPQFAVPSLDLLVKSGYPIVAVLTSPDKPAGRGRIISSSPVKDYALENNLNVLQPANLKDPAFIKILESFNADLQVVVAFRMLPDVIWKMPRLGTFNLHASLLPQYRGAAPINRAIINGESETGVTTFFINENIDTGSIIFSERIKIEDTDTAGSLHDRLMYAGAQLVLKTVETIAGGHVTTVSQDQLISKTYELKTAPKIFKEDCKINWHSKTRDIYNLIRGLSPYPAAFTKFHSLFGDSLNVKIYESSLTVDAEKDLISKDNNPGTIHTDQKTLLYVSCADGLISIKELQLEGKRRMDVKEFLRGFKLDKYRQAE